MKLSAFKRSVAALAVVVPCAFFSQAFAQQAAAPKGDIEAAKGKISMCIGCHGIPEYRASFPEVYRVPKISGQNADYIVAALKEYKSGARTFPSMVAIAKSLSDQDMLDIAAYFSQVK